MQGLSLEQKHGFLNISITPIECSVVCHVSWAKQVFAPAIQQLPLDAQAQVSISKETYIVFSVSSAGMEAGQRVIDLTAPLAMAGIPIFFITTYYTDFILVPTRDRQSVGAALLARGFSFSEDNSAYVAPMPLSPARTRGPSTSTSGSRRSSENDDITTTSTTATANPPPSPPPSTVSELQTRTFAQLRKQNVVPFVEPGLHLAQCSGKELPRRNGYTSPPTSGRGRSSSGHGGENAWLDHIDPKLYVGLVSALAQQPRFLSLTLAQDDAPSLLLDKALLWLFGNSIAGDTNGDLVPIFLDLRDLPLESTGIVCGVAGKLVDEMYYKDDVVEGEGGGKKEERDPQANELSYLSTARAGAVILWGEASEGAMKALRPLLEKPAEE